jgi:hypothetical protein
MSIIEIDVGLQAKSKAEIDEYLEKVNKIKEVLQLVRESEQEQQKEKTDKMKEVSELVREAEQKEEEITKKSKKGTKEKEEKTELTEALEGLSSSDVKKLQSFLKNPQGMIEGGIDSLFKRLGPNSAVILGIAGAVIAAPIFFIEFMKALSVKGGPFNRDFRRFIANEVDVGLDRELVKRRELGLEQVIFTQTRGFVPNNPMSTYNSLYDVNQSRIARIGLDDREAGVTVF